ncbi:glycosyltransferase family 4 protein [Brevibacillus fulvus]|uniref:Glycosyltransferase involved in cell wall biosynthesis n=1 Tax=Brevibacillus fulvus TaxID=1125967 RepID=A0A938XZ93_9BACL|nr:glycosyltransferase family 4 protein [Brevibacillus fulvus]MBM7590420.1 glycosyltransferase involved in cell wall biosynthesis [Brevibacillus fulvus]
MLESPARILMVMDSLDMGGTETHVLSLSKVLRELGGELYYLGADGPFREAFVNAGFQVHLTDSQLNLLPADHSPTIKRFGDLIRQANIDVVHVHQTPSGLLAAAAAKQQGVPVVFTLHGTYYPRAEAIKLAQMSDAAISVSKPVQRFWQKAQIVSQVIPNGIDPASFAPVSAEEAAKIKGELQLTDDATIITYVSRLAWGKATVCDMVMRAVKSIAADISHLHLLIVGAGAEFKRIQSIAQSINRSFEKPLIQLIGEQADVRPFYGLSTIIVGTGRVALEAMACGKPVLAVGNHGFFGLVTPDNYTLAWEQYFGDHDSRQKTSIKLLADGLREALAEPVLLADAGARGREWISQTFPIQRIGQELMDVYRLVMTGQQGKGGRA